jgi:hypothetical protein
LWHGLARVPGRPLEGFAPLPERLRPSPDRGCGLKQQSDRSPCICATSGSIPRNGWCSLGMCCGPPRLTNSG